MIENNDMSKAITDTNKNENKFDNVVDVVIKEICVHSQLTREQVLNKTRRIEFVLARQKGMYFLKKYTKMSLSAIGKVFYKDHATVLHSVKVINNYCLTDKTFRDELRSLDDNIIESISNFKGVIDTKISDLKTYKDLYLALEGITSFLVSELKYGKVDDIENVSTKCFFALSKIKQRQTKLEEEWNT